MAGLSLPGLTRLHPTLAARSGAEGVQEEGDSVLEIHRQLVMEVGFFQPLLPTEGEHGSGDPRARSEVRGTVDLAAGGLGSSWALPLARRMTDLGHVT